MPATDDPLMLSLILAAAFAGGLGAGMVYFRALWWQVRRYADGGGLRGLLGLTVLRFALLAGVLGLAAIAGALALLVAAIGVLVGRFVVMRRLKGATS